MSIQHMRSSDKGIVYIIHEKWYDGAKVLTELKVVRLFLHFADEGNYF